MTGNTHYKLSKHQLRKMRRLAELREVVSCPQPCPFFGKTTLDKRRYKK